MGLWLNIESGFVSLINVNAELEIRLAVPGQDYFPFFSNLWINVQQVKLLRRTGTDLLKKLICVRKNTGWVCKAKGNGSNITL